jgi:hypothetical protein
MVFSLWLSLSLVVGSEQVHRWLHQDSSNGQHTCVFTLLKKGEFLAIQPSAPAAAAPPLDYFAGAVSENRPILSVNWRFSPSRAPPVLIRPV